MFSVGLSGALTQVAGSPFTLGAEPRSVVFSPSGGLLAVTAGKEEAQSLYMFSVSASGALTPVSGSPYSASSSENVAFSPTGGLLAAQVKTGVKMFSVGASGALMEVAGSPFVLAQGNPMGIAFRPNGNLVVGVRTAGSEVFTTYSVSSSGALTPVGSGTITERLGIRADVFSADGSMVATARPDVSEAAVYSIGSSGAVSTLQSISGPTPITQEPGGIAFSSTGMIATEGNGALAVFVPSSTSSHTDWVGSFGSEGYDLAGWNGTSDLTNLPNASVSLVKGSRCLWAASTTDQRALTAPDGLTRTAAGYCDPSEVQVKLTFNAAYSGHVRLYAVDWPGGGGKEHETLTVGSQSVGFSDNPDMGSDGFAEGQWAIFSVSVLAGESLTIKTKVEPGWPITVLSGIFLGDAPPAAAVATSPQGTWTGALGHEGYDLAAWDGQTDASNIPGAILSLTQGSRYEWASSTEDPRALQSPDGLTREAATYYDPNQIRLSLKFNAAYSGNLHLYALDWDSTVRRETITVNGQSAALSSEFNKGAWVSFPISVAAGETVSILVERTAGANAVLSGIFLGEGGAPPGPTVTSSPQGAWSGAVGSGGYALAGWDGSGGDVSYLPKASLSLLQGSRYQWTQGTGDARALSDPSGLTHNAGTYYDPNQIQLKLSFPAAYSGNLHLYAVDWDSTARRETISVNGSSVALGEFNKGAWVTFPISVAAGGTVTITVDRTAGANAVLSGMFLGDSGTPPAMASSSAPQGSWVGTYGSGGYDLLGFSGSSDLSSFTNAAVSVEQASRYQWASSTSDARALQSPDKSTRIAATLYDPNQVRLRLNFAAAYTGNLELYAVDWDSTARREMVSVNGQTAVLSGEFNKGAWVSFPISVAAGATVTITVDRLAGANAVLSGIFLG
jgi:6-phosphogluconolactonase (cycloisomerase 2 family)